MTNDEDGRRRRRAARRMAALDAWSERRARSHVHRCPVCYETPECGYAHCAIEWDLRLDDGRECGAFVVCSSCRIERATGYEPAYIGESARDARDPAWLRAYAEAARGAGETIEETNETNETKTEGSNR